MKGTKRLILLAFMFMALGIASIGGAKANDIPYGATCTEVERVRVTDYWSGRSSWQYVCTEYTYNNRGRHHRYDRWNDRQVYPGNVVRFDNGHWSVTIGGGRDYRRPPYHRHDRWCRH